VKDKALKGIGAKEHLLDWDSIPWKSIEKNVRNLRQRIFRATRECQWNKVRSLMKLMLRSFSNLLLSVRKVTQQNKGRKTAGIDNRLVLDSKSRARLVRQLLKNTPWKVSPGRRIYIPKANGKRRPLGILTIADRATQAVVKNALEPSWEAQFESYSYGFRPGRSCRDAIEHCWICLNGWSRQRWVLDADIKGAFDNINHQHILDRIGKIPGREMIKQWLKAGYVEEERFHATTSGVQQGGVISPLLANIALDGMQSFIGPTFGFIRYADDFVVTARSKEELEILKPKLETWLKARGLELNEEKTRIVSVLDGFDFLGFHIQHFQGKCLTKPQKGKVLALVAKLKEWLRNHTPVSPEVVIHHLNPILIGWANFYKHSASKRIFGYVDSQIWMAIWKWCLNRHPNKSKGWVKQKYYTSFKGRQWSFFARTKDRRGNDKISYITTLSDIKVTRYGKVKGTASPDDPSLKEYWERRKAKSNKTLLVVRDELLSTNWRLELIEG